MARIEHDFIGDLEVPANAYYGVQSLRGKENFFITEEKNNQEIYFIIAFAYVTSFISSRSNPERRPALRMDTRSILSGNARRKSFSLDDTSGALSSRA